MQTKNFIRVGHPAYSGANHAQWTNNKSKAIEILRERGVKRDDARKVADDAINNKRHLTVKGGMFGNDTIEIAAFDPERLA